MTWVQNDAWLFSFISRPLICVCLDEREGFEVSLLCSLSVVNRA